jgi:hypothetical protein
VAVVAAEEHRGIVQSLVPLAGAAALRARAAQQPGERDGRDVLVPGVEGQGQVAAERETRRAC